MDSTTAEIVYRRPDRHWFLQTYVWQDYDMFPNFPALKDFLAFWEKSLEGPLLAVTVAHSKLIKPAELHAVDGILPSKLGRGRPRRLWHFSIFSKKAGEAGGYSAIADEIGFVRILAHAIQYRARSRAR